MLGPTSGRARLRGLFAVVAALGVIVALGVLAGASWSATGSSSASQYQYGTKVTICHHTHSKKNPWVTITISQAAVPAHLRHGDTLGACTTSNKGKKAHGKPTETTTTTTTTSTEDTSTTGHGQSGDHGNGKGHGHH